jgi:hypothetical protein
MPATAARAQFISQETRLGTQITNAAVVTAYSDLARNTDGAPFETAYSSLADVDHATVETSNLIGFNARAVTQSANANEVPDFDFDTVTPSARAIDSDLALDRVGLISARTISLLNNVIELETWG